MGILVIGESLIDIVSTAGHRDRYSPGGAPANVALGLGRLGDEVEFLTDVGDDFHGGFLLAHLRESRVDVLTRPTGATSTALARLAADGSADYDFRLRWDPDDSLVADDERSVLHFGSIAAFLQPGAAAVDRLLERAASATGAAPRSPLVTFDPNIRPSIIGTHTEALHRFEELAARVDVVKLSDADADWLYPELDETAQMDRILDLGAGMAAMTRGGDGAIVATASARAEVDAVRVDVRDTIGAGDTFMVSLIHELHANATEVSTLGESALTRLAERAVRLAAITVGREGADLPWAEDLTN
ncbi:carbohydrate kinase family protein [Brevibacterium atlanticum]|uniref:carbohydrate kinase family protein n=1 Tax=Brevibacterium atlanticum TaxID=2697563 RepID=UPI001422CA3E|nr:carbohydrate kinase [Brevibacterium atlanticum]